MVIRPHISAGVTLAAASVIVAAQTISPPLTPRDEKVVAEASYRLSSASVDLTAASQPLVVQPATLLQGVALVNRVSGTAAPAIPLAAVAPDAGADAGTSADESAGSTALVVEHPNDFFGGLLNAYLNGGSTAVTAYVALAVSDQVFGKDSVPSALLGAYVKQGLVGVVGTTALLISNQVNGAESTESKAIADFLNGGLNKTIGDAFLAYSNEKYGEGSFASGLTSSFFFGYPDGEKGAPTGLGGVTRFVFDSLVKAITDSINKPTVSPTGAVSLVSQSSILAAHLEEATDAVGASVTTSTIDAKTADAVEHKVDDVATEKSAAKGALTSTATEEPATATKSEIQADPEAETNVDVKAETKAETKADTETETKADVKTEAKPDTKVDAKADVKTETKPEAKPDNKSDAKSEHKAETKPDNKTEAKADAKTETNAATKDAVKGPKKESGSTASTSKKSAATGGTAAKSPSSTNKASASDSGSGHSDGDSKKESKGDS